eukprot:3590210-Alexandrium_andersonii.AAC.1
MCIRDRSSSFPPAGLPWRAQGLCSRWTPMTEMRLQGGEGDMAGVEAAWKACLLYTSPSPRD